MPKIRLNASAAIVTLVVLTAAACGGNDDSNAPTSSPSATTSASATSAHPLPSASEATPPPAETTAPADDPSTFDCADPAQWQPGTAIYPDGGTGYEPECDTSTATETVPGEQSEATQPQGYGYDPNQDRNGDGVVNGYERCGTACGEAPTSGETQLQYGCQQGWVDAATCRQAGY